MYKMAFVVSFAFSLNVMITAPVAQAQSQSLNDTGQTLCFESGVLVACSAVNTGDSGTTPRHDARFGRDAMQVHGALVKTGAGEAAFDFSKIANDGTVLPATAVQGGTPGTWGCTKDNVTGLMWEMKINMLGSSRNPNYTYTWYDTSAANTGVQGTATNCSLSGSICNTQNYIAAINAAGLCGYNDWRLPTRRELLSIVHFGRSNPAVDATYFPFTLNQPIWTSVTSTNTPTSAFTVDMGNGVAQPTAKGTASRLRLVRGTPLGEPNFSDLGDGTVRDSTTGLMWAKCNVGQSGNTCSSGAAAAGTWSAATALVVQANENNYLGYNDWRMPNAKELESLGNLSRSGQVIDTGFFPNAGNVWLWSSTSFVADLAYSWIFTDAGVVSRRFMDSSAFRLRLVRGGGYNAFDQFLPPTTDLNVRNLIWQSGASFSAGLDSTPPVNAIAYWLVLPAGSPAPKVSELAAGNAAGTLDAGSSSIISGNWIDFDVGHLKGATNYTLYYGVQSNFGMNLINKLPFMTTHEPPPPDLLRQRTHVDEIDYRDAGQTLIGTFVPAVADRGQNGSVFIFAYLPPTSAIAPGTAWVLDSGLNWHSFVDCRVTPAYYTGELTTLNNLPIVPMPVDLSALAGSELYIGYGVGNHTGPGGQACNDMMARQNWVKVYTAS